MGKVCALSDRFDWFSEKPLKGKRIVVNQPARKASDWRASAGSGRGNPSLSVYPNGFYPAISPDFDAFDTLVFTSTEGVRSFFSYLFEQGRDARAVYGKKLACIGSATAEALREFGLSADFLPSVFDGNIWEK